jgi:hypothetical protein
MMDAIQQRLRAQVPALRLVEGAGEYAALQQLPPREKMPAAYVLPMDDSARPNSRASQLVRQDVERRITILLMTRSARDTRGESAAEQLEPILSAIRAGLIGWTPTLSAQPAQGAQMVDATALEFRRGRLVGIDDGVLSWSEEYACRAVLRVSYSGVP